MLFWITALKIPFTFNSHTVKQYLYLLRGEQRSREQKTMMTIYTAADDFFAASLGMFGNKRICKNILQVFARISVKN